MQSKKGSAAEVCANLAVGYSVNFMANMLVLPMFGITGLTIEKNLGLGVIFTLISITRQYVLRRWFNNFKWSEKK